jgi:hypothetical protein
MLHQQGKIEQLVKDTNLENTMNSKIPADPNIILTKKRAPTRTL